MKALRAVLIADLAGFSDTCEREGVEAGIAEAKRFWRIAQAEAEAHGGEFVKGWADNVAAVFPSVDLAEACALDLVQLVRCACGIGWGEVVLPPGDLWGVEVNRASRLGEDVAQEGEVLLTDAARLEVRRSITPAPPKPSNSKAQA